MTKALMLSLGLLLAAAVSNANPEGHHHHNHGSCAKDVETHCPGVEGGHGAIVKCLKENEAKLTSECSAHMTEAREAMKDVKEACHEDFEKFCHDVKPGRGRVMKCMKKHHAELSEACKAEIKEKKEARKKKAS